ncbi:UBC-like protein [Coccomyxa subellipsoidea C-169]|uniref:UBC-like protein n=1 Tax=Coccomyxa subellipsoidea (strain C-169) TaxID=574566 RepID=I0Z195_COCSC|nr:UBC-like protein [Coccomyxa subellipsoidea C-169]EIE24414.1 UBC-like protein [Coccomyxa subellipsoidea C-169]|eukprot:XP_005648958.1 UBC-like protein [Coccomyxa subellipsoidea C-169]
MQEGKFNMRNPAVKRILQEMKELQKDPSIDFMAAALEDNIFEWHFAVRGPPDTEFQGGIFHGRILLPPEYPFKPPSFLMLSPNGRFETNVKICLSISSHHPEHWQPSWSVRTALTALIAFFPTAGNGAIGSLDYAKEDRAALAAKSREQPPQFGNAERQAVTNEIHAAMLAAEEALVRLSSY